MNASYQHKIEHKTKPLFRFQNCVGWLGMEEQVIYIWFNSFVVFIEKWFFRFLAVRRRPDVVNLEDHFDELGGQQDLRLFAVKSLDDVLLAHIWKKWISYFTNSDNNAS